MISVTVFKNTFDNKTHRRINYDTWQSFEEALYNMSAKSGNKGGTNSSPLISPATYIENTTRANKNVVCCIPIFETCHSSHYISSSVMEFTSFQSKYVSTTTFKFCSR